MTYSRDYEYKDPTAHWGPKGDWFMGKFDPDTLVPWPCSHGLAHPGSLNVQGKPLPAMGGLSWGRAKHISITAYGARSDAPFAIVKCIQCIAESRDEPFTPPADFPR